MADFGTGRGPQVSLGKANGKSEGLGKRKIYMRCEQKPHQREREKKHEAGNRKLCLCGICERSEGISLSVFRDT